jgi:hypothetical protein
VTNVESRPFCVFEVLNSNGSQYGPLVVYFEGFFRVRLVGLYLLQSISSNGPKALYCTSR